MSVPITNLPIPNLDDRRFDDLMKEARSLILNYNKEWTNHNPSDPGITILELFAWLSEMVIYRINQVPVESHINFLKLIAGTPGKGDPEKILGSTYLFDWNDFKPDGEIRLRNFLKTELDIEWAANITYLFGWDEIPGNDNGRLIEFLAQDFGIDWVKTATIEKTDENNTIKVSIEGKFLLLKLNDEKTEVNLIIDDGRTDEFKTKMENGKLNIYNYTAKIIKYDHSYFFCWDDVPGNDTKILTEFLKKRFFIDWIDKANIEKIENTTIKLSSGNNFISLGLNNENTKASLITDNGRTDEYIVKDENGKLNIYNPSIKTLLVFSGKNRVEITVDEIEGNGYLKINGCNVRYLHAGEFLFSWDDVPGTDSVRLIEFLEREFSIDWAETAKIEKIDKTIKLSTVKNFLLLELNNEKTRINMKIDNYRTVEFIAKAEGGKLNIYSGELKVYNVPDMDDAFKTLLTFLKDIDEGKKNNITEIKQAPVEFMESMYRAITSEDYEEKAKDCMKILLQKDPPGRAVCMTNRKLLYSKGIKEYQVNEELPGHVSVIIIPRGVENSKYCEEEGKPTDRLLEEIKAYLDARRLITTRVHVVNPVYINVSLRVRLALKENIKQNEVISEAGRKINEYFNPISGGPEGTGWPLGRHIYRSEVYNLLESIPGIDHVAKIEIDENEGTREIMKHQLIALDKLDIETVSYE